MAIHEAAGEEFAVISDPERRDDIRTRFQLPPRFILADGIKNPGALIAGWTALPPQLRREFMLVFFSREPRPRPAVAQAMGSLDIRFIPQPSSRDLAGIMSLAAVFAFPSWYEGFGLPLVEAMQCGTPIVASSRGSIPEVVGDAGLIADIDVPGAFGTALRTMLEDEEHRGRLAANALARAQQFSWQRAARETLQVYEDVAAGLRRTA